jgi:hypothetical protein
MDLDTQSLQHFLLIFHNLPKEYCKPEGTAVELIDCVIRIFDYLGKTGVDVEKLLIAKHEYNKSRPYRHGGKKL